MVDRKHIGLESKETVYEVEKGAIRQFAEAIGDPNPIYVDEAAARAAGYPGIIAPPTFATIFRGGRDLYEKLELDFRYLLHGEQEYEHFAPLHPGDTVSVKARVADITEKKGRSGGMFLVKLELEGRRQSGDLAFIGRSTLVIRKPE